ncbi:hypothetical protein SAMN06295885_2575 [Rathayibacter oskolensis]|uniref:Uncharacterized protein n=1 Tax=Rathayibacter oskolensis TaxID=1891671 RepID=A0A1X7P4H5_9MICO|nr:hypothetical protein [Rathayibacter oskolensis]SMH45614.1 hypothetical protein SAMN06295885_2575 [Rathayibacter oskolensis]
MTLTALLPGLRRSIPDPLNVNAWPELTRASTTDVVVSGVSLVRLVEVCGTPCVHVAAGVVPGTGGRPAPDRQATAIVVAVTEAKRDSEGRLEIVIDACLDAVPAVWAEMRVIGRASCAHAHPTTVLGTGRSAGTACEAALAVLPDDLREGDLLAVPCPDAVVLRDLRPVPEASVAPATPSVADGQPAWLHALE